MAMHCWMMAMHCHHPCCHCCRCAGLEYMDDGNTLLYRARSSDMQLSLPNKTSTLSSSQQKSTKRKENDRKFEGMQLDQKQQQKKSICVFLLRIASMPRIMHRLETRETIWKRRKRFYPTRANAPKIPGIRISVIRISRYSDIRIRANAASDFASFPNVFLIRRARKRLAMKPTQVQFFSFFFFFC